MSVQSVCEEHIGCFAQGYLMSLEDELDIPTKNNECVLHSWIEHECIVFITYYTFDVDLIDCYRFTLGTILYKKVVPAM